MASFSSLVCLSSASLISSQVVDYQSQPERGFFPRGSIQPLPQGKLKERLKNGEKLVGAFSLTFSPIVAEILGHVGYDYVVIDLEHGPGDVMAALPIMQALACTNTPAIIRLPENNSTWAKKALDIGPAGIMFPKIDTAKAAQKAVMSCRYPPAGIRGAAYPLIRATNYGLNSPSYLSQCEDDLLIMCQIESQAGVKNIKEIASVDGVDVLQTGPRDLRSDMGLLQAPHDNRPNELLREAEEVMKSAGVHMGGFATSDDSSHKLLELGYNMVIGAYDVALLRDAALANLQGAKKTTVT